MNLQEGVKRLNQLFSSAEFQAGAKNALVIETFSKSSRRASPTFSIKKNSEWWNNWNILFALIMFWYHGWRVHVAPSHEAHDKEPKQVKRILFACYSPCDMFRYYFLDRWRGQWTKTIEKTLLLKQLYPSNIMVQDESTSDFIVFVVALGLPPV